MSDRPLPLPQADELRHRADDPNLERFLRELAGELGVSRRALGEFATSARVRRVKTGEPIIRQYCPAEWFYLLWDGSVEMSLRVEEEAHELSVGERRDRWMPMGWSGFRAPQRYDNTITATSPSVLLAWRHGDLGRCFARQPVKARRFLTMVANGAMALLADVRERLADSLRRTSPALNMLNSAGEEDVVTNTAPAPLEVLRRSAFFSEFDESVLARVAEAAQLHYFYRGERLVEQGQNAKLVHVLASGKTQVRYQAHSGVDLTLGALDAPGQLLSWQALSTDASYGVSIVALRDGAVLKVPPAVLLRECAQKPGFGVHMLQRLLWIVGRHLRSARAQLISERFDQELLAVRSTIEQNSTQLSVTSPLHMLPHLLANPVTLDLAFQIADSVAADGSALEAHIARSCCEVLHPVRAEQKFFSALGEIYQSVVSASRESSTEDVRRACASKFRTTFERIPHAIMGTKYLPKRSGHIFIFNHLRNHEYNTLPNSFQLTLDSHFISAMVLFEHYGDPGIRVVRKSRAAEYAHHLYYERLGHISVYTRESDEPNTPREARQKEFFDTARSYLERGVNLIIAPEGTSRATEESPGEFRAGAFRLALSLAREPLIVPIAVANFDRRLNHTALGVVVKRPFKVSERVGDPNDPLAMRRFLVRLQKRYRSYVREAAEVADTCWERCPEQSALATLPPRVDSRPRLLELELLGGRG